MLLRQRGARFRALIHRRSDQQSMILLNKISSTLRAINFIAAIGPIAIYWLLPDPFLD